MAAEEPGPVTRLADRGRSFRPPPDWTRVTVVDAHAAGEPLRVVVAGYPELAGDGALERRAHAREAHDDLRTVLMWEPRGHADMYGCVVVPPTEGADFGVVFTHNAGYSTMCGHGIIAVVTVLIELGVFEPAEPERALEIDTPAGRVHAVATCREGRVLGVRFRNVPSFVVDLDASVDVPGLGTVRYDLAFGGAFYAYVDAARTGLRLVPSEAAEIVAAGRAVKRAVAADREIPHPDPELSFLYGTIFVGPPRQGAHSRHACVFAEGELDRSPTGTGVSGRLAILHERREIDVLERVEIESILGTKFGGRVVDETRAHGRDAVVSEVDGRAWLTGRSEFWVDPSDPLGAGFLLR